MKNITLKINGQNNFDDAKGADTIDVITEGKLYKKRDAIYLVYEENETMGFDKCKTTIKIDGDRVKMKRFFAEGIPTEMEFKKGMRFSSKYMTPYGPLDLEVLTYDLKNTIDEKGAGSLRMDYDVSLNGLVKGKNSIDITVVEEEEDEIQ